MKKVASVILVVLMLLCITLQGGQTVQAATKTEKSRAIAIVFDNSGSMYSSGNLAWCQATYAMEVFASMLNEGDKLLIYPMNEISVGGKTYRYDTSPLTISDASQASTIRELVTTRAGGTPIESIDAAIEGIKGVQADLKYVIVLTDGAGFHIGSGTYEASSEDSCSALDTRFKNNAGGDLTIMYLGIGSSVVMPSMAESSCFVKRQAADSEDVLSTLTEMCNLIFGRDVLPDNHISGTKIDFDMSIKKLIVFVQGDNLSNVKVTDSSGNLVGTLLSTASTKYSTKGASSTSFSYDTTLQGMIVTYTDCAAGNYTIQYSGTATSIEVYYEPDADLDFVFTDADGNVVDADAMYAGDYKVSYGLKDAKTGKLITSDLLGNPHYEGTYSVNGVSYPISSDGASGEVLVTLEQGDTFDAQLTATYLSGYTITKDATDFGWPSGGIQVTGKPAGALTLEITGGEDSYSLLWLEDGEPYILKVYYEGLPLTGDALQSVELELEDAGGYAKIDMEFADDHYKLYIRHKDASNPLNTGCGESTVTVRAVYELEGYALAQANTKFTYDIDEDLAKLGITIEAAQKYIVISEIDDSEAYTIRLTLDGQPLTEEEFQNLTVEVDCDGLKYTLTPNAQDSSYQLKFQSSSNISAGKYKISVSARYTDSLGRQSEASNKSRVSLGNVPLWLKWTVGIASALILLIIILVIMHIPALPKYVRVSAADSYMTVAGAKKDGVTYKANLARKNLRVWVMYGDDRIDLKMDVKPAKDSYLKTSQRRRRAKVLAVRPEARIQRVEIGGNTYEKRANGGWEWADMDGKTPNITVANGAIIGFSGFIEENGRKKAFVIETQLEFRR